MKHKLIDRQPLGGHRWRVIVELLPDTEAEAKAIQRVELAQASEQERELVENYLHFSLGFGNYSIVQLLRQQNYRIALEIVK